MPKHLRQRTTIADSLFSIRTLRNRIYHCEPIFNNLETVNTQHAKLIAFIGWLDTDLLSILDGIDRFDEILKKAKAL